MFYLYHQTPFESTFLKSEFWKILYLNALLQNGTKVPCTFQVGISSYHCLGFMLISQSGHINLYITYIDFILVRIYE